MASESEVKENLPAEGAAVKEVEAGLFEKSAAALLTLFDVAGSALSVTDVAAVERRFPALLEQFLDARRATFHSRGLSLSLCRAMQSAFI